MGYKDVIRSAMNSNDAFVESLKKDMDSTGVSIKKISEISNVPVSTLYKIMSGERSDPQLSTFRQIIFALRKMEGKDVYNNMVAIVASTAVIDNFTKPKLEDVHVKGYIAASYEEVIVASVRAEKDGAKAIVCAPIMAGLIEKLVNIPVVGLKPSESEIESALDIAIRKAGNRD